ncbi:MAG: hypothetical protein HY928_00055 [Elusimicrobia bacterium]|nr:hypothetical protein [Elusimicrobiota bacterium]
MPDAESAEDRFNRAFFGFLDRVFLVVSFGEAAGLGVEFVAEGLGRKYASLAQALVKGRDFAAMAARPGDLSAGALPKDWTESLTRRAVAGARPTLEAACFVYAHTVLEAAALEFSACLGRQRPRTGSAANAVAETARLCGLDGLDLRALSGFDALRDAAVRDGAPVPGWQAATLEMLETALRLAAGVAARGGFRLDPAGLLRAAPKPARRSGSARPSRTRRARRSPAP